MQTLDVVEEPQETKAARKTNLESFFQTELLPVWRGQVDDWHAGVKWIIEKTGWSVSAIRKDVLPWVHEWNRQKDAADRAGKFMAELPNIGVFFRKQKWKNPLPYSFQELRETKNERGAEVCQCGQPAFNRKYCAKCYTKIANPEFVEHMKAHLRTMGLSRKPGESWREASLRCLKANGLSLPRFEHE